jgi:hypothetical protein
MLAAFCATGSAAAAPATGPAAAAPAIGPAAAPAPVTVHIPLGLRSDFATTSPGVHAGTVFVTIGSIVAVNPSSTDFEFYEPHDFHLIALDRTYYPVVRPGLASLDISTSGMVAPLGSLRVTATFEVPLSTRDADLEFIPAHWFDDHGGSVAFCCYYP